MKWPRVLFRLCRWENLRTCQGKFDQEAKDRVVRLVEDRILAENMSMQEACKIVAPKNWVFRGTQRGNGRKPARREGRVTERLPEDLAAPCKPTVTRH
ncbi:hypothetical protein CIP102550_00351 [Corynebacterium diphtheriae]|nr:hypothetical protein CIP102550_00351 [Corynebacterium diphtheriae]